MATMIEIYEALQSHAMCNSQTELSERGLGHSGGYLAFFRLSGAACCPVSMQLLAERLQRCADELRHPDPIVDNTSTTIAL